MLQSSMSFKLPTIDTPLGPIDPNPIVKRIGEEIIDRALPPSANDAARRKLSPFFPMPQEPIVTGDLNPCPPGFHLVRHEGIFGGGTTTCVPDGTPSPIGQPIAQTPVSGNGCGCGTGCCMPNGTKGRPNKTGYFLKSGQYVPPGSKCVSRRSMNPLNPKAARKAVSRLNRVVNFQKSVEKSLRKLAPTPARRTKKAPAHHHHAHA